MTVATLALVAVGWLCGLLVRVDRGAGPRLELTPSLVLWLSLGAYIASLPVSRFLFGTTEAEIDLEYLLLHLEAMGGLLVGFLFAHRLGCFRRLPASLEPEEAERPWSTRAVLLLLVLLHCGYYLAVLEDVGYDPSRLLDRYGAVGRSYEEATLLSTAVSVGATAVSWLACQAALRQRLGWEANGLVWGATTLLATLYLLRGNRNSLIILLLPIAAGLLHRRRLPPGRLLIVAVGGWLALYTVAIVRNWGFGRLEEVNVSLDAYDPVRGEMGTMYSVYQKYMLRGLMDSTPLYGESYVIAPLVNLVPREWWRERPHTIAQEASVTYYGTGTLTSGIGFSPVIEAIRNFGRAAVGPVLAVVAAMIALLERLLDRRLGARSLLGGALLPMIVNYCRIDFATVFKMTLLYMASLLACHLLARERGGGEDQDDLERAAAAALRELK